MEEDPERVNDGEGDPLVAVRDVVAEGDDVVDPDGDAVADGETE